MPSNDSHGGLPRVVVVTTDLILSSKVCGTAKALGIISLTCRSALDLQDALGQGAVRLVVVDMSMPDELACGTIRLAADCEPRPSIVAVYSHVETAKAEAAWYSGATTTLPRSKFSVELPRILHDTCGRAD